VFAAPATITLTANAADPDGTVARVDFFDGATLVGTVTSAPYSTTLANLAVGTHTLTAKATDNLGLATTSSAVSIRVDAPPSVSITSPAANATFNAPASVPITVNAQDTDGTINRVELYANSALIATLTVAPYSFNWTNVAAGTYALTAKAVDNNNAQTLSAAVTITVRTGVAALYFIHTDHLNTPRLVANAAGTTVWRWDQQEPFGNDTPNGDPGNTGTTFDFPMRFPGQYLDRETNLAYNFYRDYDPQIGKYIQSDPVGIRAGADTYTFVRNGPLSFADFFGLIPMSMPRVRINSGSAGCGTEGYGGLPPDLFFEGCCNKHDDCYDDCKNQPSKDSCDRDFSNCTMRQCSGRWIGIKFVCEYLAVIYAEGPRRGGDDAFHRARAKCAAGICTR
jgi:RHS repeat-associated protein